MLATKRETERFIRYLHRFCARLGPDALPVNGYSESSDLPLGQIVDRLAVQVRRRYRPVFKPLPNNGIDRKGSVLGGFMFASARYPVPLIEGPGQFAAWPAGPLAQLDLDEIRLATGTDAGSGLLQVWKRGDYDAGFLDETIVRRIPRWVVDRTKRLQPMKDLTLQGAPFGVEIGVDLEFLELADPLAAKATHDQYEFEYNDCETYPCSLMRRAWAGHDWRWSRAVRMKSQSHDPQGLPPQQMVGWRQAGWTWPDYFEFEDLYRYCDGGSAESALLDKAVGDRSHWSVTDGNEPPWVLFGEPFTEDSPSLPWQPLFSFPGPMADSEYWPDNYQVFWRQCAGRFDYTADFDRGRP